MKLFLPFRRLFIGLGIFFALSAIGFSFRGTSVQWLWQGQPFIAILLMLLAFGAAYLLWLIERSQFRLRLQRIREAMVIGVKTPDPLAQLSQREQEVLALIAAGKTNQQIADELFVELSTVKTHINNIYKTLGLRNRKEAAELGRKNR